MCVCVWWEWDFCVWICRTYTNNVPLAGRVNLCILSVLKSTGKSNLLSCNFSLCFSCSSSSQGALWRSLRCRTGFYCFFLSFIFCFVYIRCVVKPCRWADGHEAWADDPQELQSGARWNGVCVAWNSGGKKKKKRTSLESLNLSKVWAMVEGVTQIWFPEKHFRGKILLG